MYQADEKRYEEMKYNQWIAASGSLSGIMAQFRLQWEF